MTGTIGCRPRRTAFAQREEQGTVRAWYIRPGKENRLTTQARNDTARSHGYADFRLLEFYFGGRLWMRRLGFESFGSAERFDVCQLKTCLCLGSLATNLGGGGFLGDPEGLCEQVLAFVRFGLHDSHIVHMDIVGFSCDEFFITVPTGHQLCCRGIRFWQ